MGRPLNKKTLSLLRPTANVSVSSSELPANILRQKSSIGFIVQTADGENLCTLTANDPQPGQMRLQAFAEDGSTYYVTDISKELITVQQGTGTVIPDGSEIGWDLNIGTDQSLILANKTQWKWLTVDGNDTGVWGFNINSDKSTYIFGYDVDTNHNTVTKLSPRGEVEWSTVISQGTDIDGSGFGAICDQQGNVYITNSYSTDNITYFAKLNSRGEIMWQKNVAVYTGYYATDYYAYLDSQSNLHACLSDGTQSTIIKFDTNGQIIYQKDIISPAGYGNYVIGNFLPDDTFLAFCNNSQLAGDLTATLNVIRLDQNGNIIRKFAFNDPNDPITPYVQVEIIRPDSNSNIFCGGGFWATLPNKYGFFCKLSLKGEMIWHRGYGNGTEDYPKIAEILFDKSNNIYTVFIGNVGTIVAKWNTNGDLIWDKLIKNSDNTLYWNYTITSTQIVDNHLYIEFYHYDAPIYDQQPIIRLNIDNPENGSFTEPYQYTVTDAADDGYGVVSSNLAITTSNISVADGNYTFTNTNFTQENITVNYEFGF